MEVNDVAIVPIIVGLVEVCKRLGLPGKFSPIIGLVLGVIIGMIYVSPTDIAQGVLVGASLGLSAVGLYSGVKNTAEMFTEE